MKVVVCDLLYTFILRIVTHRPRNQQNNYKK